MSLCLTNYHVINMYGRVDVWLHVFLTSALDVSGWSASLPSALISGKGFSVLTGDEVDCGKERNPAGNSTPRPRLSIPLSGHYTD
jgi:hypothetical protein